MVTEYDAFADTYDLEGSRLLQDLDFWLGLARAAEPPVLELAAGTGRVTIPIAEAGVPVVGLDSSVEMLAVAREKTAGRELPVTWLEADMSDFELEQQFGLVICPNRAFLHLLTPDDHLRCLQTVRRHLKPGGRFATNFFVPDVETIAAHVGKLGSAVMHRRRFTDPHAGQEVVVWENREYVQHRQLILTQFMYQWLNDDGDAVRTHHRHYSLCWIWPNEFRHLLARAGFEVVALFGGFDRRRFDDTSTEQVWLARRPA